jgi:riboflavin biosynthesis pyrimidine reductase
MTRQLLPDVRPLAGPADLEALYVVPGEHLRVNFVTSIDGAIEISGRSGPLGGPADKDAFMAMRAVADVILVGAGTARAEDYGPVRMDDSARERRAGRGQSARPPLAVVSGRGALRRDTRLFDDGAEVILLTTGKGAADHPELAEAAEVVVCGEAEVDVVAAVGELRRRGLDRILCEGGPTLSRELFGAGLVDELCVTFSPVMAGEGLRRLSEAWPDTPAGLRLLGLVEGDGMLIARYGTRL